MLESSFDILDGRRTVACRPRRRPLRLPTMQLWSYRIASGLYEISFEGVGRPIPPRRIEVHEGETTEVIVDRGRK